MSANGAAALRRGNRIRIRAADYQFEWCDGHVVLASENGRSIGVSLDGCLPVPAGGAYVGSVALLIDYERETVEDFAGIPFEIEVAQ